MYTIQDGSTAHEIQSIEDLKNVPTPRLVEEYNMLEGKSIKKFSDRDTAERRIWNLIKETAESNNQPRLPGVGTARKRINAASVVRIQEDVVREAGMKHGTPGNPKRPGSQSAAVWENYQDGLTITELQKRGVSLGDVRWNEKKGFIVLEVPGQ